MPQVNVRFLLLFWILMSVVWFDMDTVLRPGICACATKLNPERRRIGKKLHMDSDVASEDEIEVESNKKSLYADDSLFKTLSDVRGDITIDGPFQRVKDVRRKKSDRKEKSRRSRKRKTSKHRQKASETDPSFLPSEQTEPRDLVTIMREMQQVGEDREGGIPHLSDVPSPPDLLYEEDIMLTPEQAEIILQDLKQDHQHRKRVKRKLTRPLAKLWTLPIPYIFDGSHSSQERYHIRQALSYWEELTCIRFKEDINAPHRLEFKKSKGCWSFVGYIQKSNQTVSIGPGCQSNGTIAHEIGHVIGFWHEQSRPDRDDYVYILEENVDRSDNKKVYNFDKREWGEIVTLDIPYDLGSDMHYGNTYYSKDPNSTTPTILTLDPLMNRVIGQRQGLSFYDIKLANKAYCEDICDNYSLTEPCRREGYQDPADCTKCRCPDGFTGQYCELVAPGVNAYCGGVYDAKFNGSIFSPGYPQGYGLDSQCTWLIKAPLESHVYIQFSGKFGVAGHVDVCQDYVEVRYNTSLTLTGARFCCTDVPKHPIKSDSHEMLVLFRTFKESRTCDDVVYPWKCKQVFSGFRATYWIKSCGGCQDRWEEKQPACKKRVSYACAQSWQEQIKVECPKWWYNEGCGLQTITRSRYGLCFRDQLYCCDTFQLDGNVCKALYPGSSNVIPAATPKTTNNKEPDSAIPVIPPTIPKVIWTDWSDFGRCSRPCGGGYMVRSRRCVVPGSCGASDIQADQRPCNPVPCYRKCPVQKSDLCGLWTICRKTVYQYCRPYCFKGYMLHQAQCVPASA